MRIQPEDYDWSRLDAGERAELMAMVSQWPSDPDVASMHTMVRFYRLLDKATAGKVYQQSMNEFHDDLGSFVAAYPRLMAKTIGDEVEEATLDTFLEIWDVNI